MAVRLELTRAQTLSFRRRVGGLEERLPPGAHSLRIAAWAGLQDSVPRAALLSIHARVSGAHPEIWDDDALVQVWGPRWAVYVVAAGDHAIFTVGRHPDDARGRERAEDMALRLRAFIAGRPSEGDLGDSGPRGRYATTTGMFLIRWDGARAPRIWSVPRPAIEPLEARRELARRYLRVFGPGTSASFGKWAGVSAPAARAAFAGLELVPVRTPLGDEWVLASDASLVREQPAPSTAVRLLPSGDAYWLCHDAARRAFLVPNRRERDALWTPRVWPGALLVAGELAGTWRRQQTSVSLEPWRRLTRAEREAVDAEIASLPLRPA
ncbi:MAG TPA: crosslink repair DNA glycosylase YcaQ family protein [Gaiellaceae bacterium]|nr:crosslink repair DNA glycosylase YcaQ family protein [Gaiellaceae bacterium]